MRKLIVRPSPRGVHLDSAAIWSAPAERSGDGALAPRACLASLKAVSPESFRGCHPTPYIPRTTNWVVVARCTRPGGAFDNSPTFQCWWAVASEISPEGTAELMCREFRDITPGSQ